MLIKVDQNNIGRYFELCKAEHIFGSRCRSALTAYGTDHDVHKFWIVTDGNCDRAVLHLNGQVLTAVKSGRIEPDDIFTLLNKYEIHEIDSDWDLCEQLHERLGGETDSSYYMVYDGGRTDKTFDAIHTANLQDVFSVLQQSHEYYRTHLEYEPWADNLSRLISCGASQVYQLEKQGEPIATCSIISSDETHAAIAAVAVVPQWRLQGIGSSMTEFLVNKIIDEGKIPCLISGYDRVAQMYEKIGFKSVGRWGELYI